MGARYYDGVTGKFISEDAAFLALGDAKKIKEITKQEQSTVLADPQLFNSYSYARNNPIINRDADGNFAFLIPLVIAATPIAVTAVATIGASIATWQWGTGLGYMLEGDHSTANSHFDASMNATAATGMSVYGMVELGNSLVTATKAVDDTAVTTKGGTYKLTDPDTGDVMRTGRTNDFVRRQAEHANNPEFRGLLFDSVHSTDNYAEQRGLEQVLHNQYNPPLNKINPISPTNPRLSEYTKAAENFLKNK